MPYDAPADGNAVTPLMIAVTQTLSDHFGYIPVSAAELPGLVQDVARRVAPQVPASAEQTPAPPDKPKRRRAGSTAKDKEPVAAAKLLVHDNAIDLAKVQITRLPARRARGL